MVARGRETFTMILMTCPEGRRILRREDLGCLETALEHLAAARCGYCRDGATPMAARYHRMLLSLLHTDPLAPGHVKRMISDCALGAPLPQPQEGEGEG